MLKPRKVVMITNIPAPYRVPVYSQLSTSSQFEFSVLFCAEKEPNRQWTLPALSFPHAFLRERCSIRKDRYVHTNPDVLRHLWRLRPSVVITTGFNPTHLLAFSYAMLTSAVHIPWTDGTIQSEKSLGRSHRLVRQIVYARSRAFVGASHGSAKLYRKYGVPERAIFRSNLAVDNVRFTPLGDGHRDFDLMFCGQLIARKLPNFAMEVAQRASDLLGRKVTILFVGTGPMERELVNQAKAANGARSVFFGHASQDQLPGLYARCKVFLFPTMDDPWGVVANEACASGLPVLISPAAGAAGELVEHGVNGEVLPLQTDAWAKAAVALLSDQERWRQLSEAALRRAHDFTFDAAARGVADAIDFGLARAA